MEDLHCSISVRNVSLTEMNHHCDNSVEKDETRNDKLKISFKNVDNMFFLLGGAEGLSQLPQFHRRHREP